ncbi:carnitine O-palmitoyltransferase 1, liver isoform-like [Tubulanus polymorphus]|uniref:carnitine O-palmitoyltransferase 1, liver isoform-like n=1 Tax=Tubulanus polymorphus TaxID=672921 RepID=UPI003DA67788
MCSDQYRLHFNTSRIPGKAKDSFQHVDYSEHVVVYHKGRYYKLNYCHEGRYLLPCELEIAFQSILDDDQDPSPGEEMLATMTAGQRIPWADARDKYFGTGLNKYSLDAIETNDPNAEILTQRGKDILYGNGHDRWCDKTFNIVITKDGRHGYHVEHSWADANVSARAYEQIVSKDLYVYGYRDDGHCRGEPEIIPPKPAKLVWDIPQECLRVIENTWEEVKEMIASVDLYSCVHTAYGKGFMKSCNVSPDGYMQMAFQLAYFRETGRFTAVQEPTSYRLFFEGRTSVTHPTTVESAAFVRAMVDDTKTDEERLELLRTACKIHRDLYMKSMIGQDTCQHLFGLSLVAGFTFTETQFMKRMHLTDDDLVTSQSPFDQTGLMRLKEYPYHAAGGGSFGALGDKGYGINYCIAGETHFYLHITCYAADPATNSKIFCERIMKALSDIRKMTQAAGVREKEKTV